MTPIEDRLARSGSTLRHQLTDLDSPPPDSIRELRRRRIAARTAAVAVLVLAAGALLLARQGRDADPTAVADEGLSTRETVDTTPDPELSELAAQLGLDAADHVEVSSRPPGAEPDDLVDWTAELLVEDHDTPVLVGQQALTTTNPQREALRQNVVDSKREMLDEAVARGDAEAEASLRAEVEQLLESASPPIVHCTSSDAGAAKACSEFPDWHVHTPEGSILVWWGMPADAAIVVLESNGRTSWQEPIEGVAAFPKDRWSGASLVAYDTDGQRVAEHSVPSVTRQERARAPEDKADLAARLGLDPADERAVVSRAPDAIDPSTAVDWSAELRIEGHDSPILVGRSYPRYNLQGDFLRREQRDALEAVLDDPSAAEGLGLTEARIREELERLTDEAIVQASSGQQRFCTSGDSGATSDCGDHPVWFTFSPTGLVLYWWDVPDDAAIVTFRSAAQSAWQVPVTEGVIFPIDGDVSGTLVAYGPDGEQLDDVRINWVPDH